MATPSWLTWRSNSSVGQGLVAQTRKDRMLAALATYVSNTNPDGTTRGT